MPFNFPIFGGHLFNDPGYSGKRMVRNTDTMATVRPYFDSFALDHLKRFLAEKVGFVPANKPDCLRLSECLLHSGCGYLSEATIYRLLFVSERHKPYKNTLDILCRFLGFADSLQFLESINQSRSALSLQGINPSSDSTNSLLFHCIEHEAHKPLADFFDSMNEASEAFKTSVTISLFDALRNSRNQQAFLRHFAHQKFVREYFFEKGHDPLFRIPEYDLGYEMYLNGINPDSSVSNLQDFLFAKSVLFRHHYLNKHARKAAAIGRQLYQRFSISESDQRALYVFPYIRFVAYKLWYLSLIQASAKQQQAYAEYLMHLCSSIRPQLSSMEQKIMFHTIAETFVHSGIEDTFHWQLKHLFASEFKTLPNLVYGKHLKHSLPYFEVNGLLYHRP